MRDVRQLLATSVSARLLLGFVALITFSASDRAQGQTAAEVTSGAPNAAQRVLQFDLFVRGDSELCDKAVSLAAKFCKTRDGIELVVHDVAVDRSALQQYWKLMSAYRVRQPVLPAFYACHRLKVGYTEQEDAATIAELFAIHAYIRPGCQHCRDASIFLRALTKRWQGMRVVFHDVINEPSARNEMLELARRHGVSAASLPGIVLCGRYISGYDSDATTGRQIEELLRSAAVGSPPAPSDGVTRLGRGEQGHTFVSLNQGAARRELTTVVAVAADAGEDLPLPIEGSSSEEQIPSLPPVGGYDPQKQNIYELPEERPEGIDVPWFGRVSVGEWGLPLFTLLIGLIDGFNPCAMWVLVFLLSVLVNVKDRRRIAAIAGVFVLVSGLVYFAFMAAWLNLFLVIDLARPLQIAVGVLALFIGIINIKDFFAFHQVVTLSIPESAKPGIYSRVRSIVTAKYLPMAVGLSVVLALLVNVVELLCTAGLPALYTQILTQQRLSMLQNYAYLALYNAAYIFDDSLMVAAFVITLSHRKMREDEGRWLKLISGVVVLALGAVVLFKPDWLQWGGG